MRVLAVALMSALALAGAGCSDGDGEQALSRHAPVSSAKARFIAAADRVCARARSQLIPLRAKTTRVTNAAATPAEAYRLYARFARMAVAIDRRSIREFRKLEPPPADRRVYDQMLTFAKRATRITADLAAAADARR